jgi:hypothetical protein
MLHDGQDEPSADNLAGHTISKLAIVAGNEDRRVGSWSCSNPCRVVSGRRVVDHANSIQE